MTRNTTRRVEVAAPVRDPDLRAHLEQVFQDQLRDTAKGRVQQPDGAYIRAQGEPFNSQEWFCGQAYAGAWALPAPRKSALRPSPCPPKRPPPSVRPSRSILAAPACWAASSGGIDPPLSPSSKPGTA